MYVGIMYSRAKFAFCNIFDCWQLEFEELLHA